MVIGTASATGNVRLYNRDNVTIDTLNVTDNGGVYNYNNVTIGTVSVSGVWWNSGAGYLYNGDNVSIGTLAQVPQPVTYGLAFSGVCKKFFHYIFFKNRF